MLNRNLVSDEKGEERNRPEIKPRSSTLTEDPSLLGKFWSEVDIWLCSLEGVGNGT